MSILFVDYDLRGRDGERREDYAALEERINLLGDALRLEYSTWLIDASGPFPVIEAFLRKTLRCEDRLLVYEAPTTMAGQGLSNEQQQWLAAHGIRILGANFAFLAVDRFEAELRRKKQLREAVAAASRRAFVPATTSTPIRPDLITALEAILGPKPQPTEPATDWLGVLGIGSPPKTL